MEGETENAIFPLQYLHDDHNLCKKSESGQVWLPLNSTHWKLTVMAGNLFARWCVYWSLFFFFLFQMSTYWARVLLWLSHLPVFIVVVFAVMFLYDGRRNNWAYFAIPKNMLNNFIFFIIYFLLLLTFVHFLHVIFQFAVFQSLNLDLTLNKIDQKLIVFHGLNHIELGSRGEPSMLSTSIVGFSGCGLVFTAVFRTACVIPFSQNARVLCKCFVTRSTLLSNRCW